MGRPPGQGRPAGEQRKRGRGAGREWVQQAPEAVGPAPWVPAGAPFTERGSEQSLGDLSLLSPCR